MPKELLKKTPNKNFLWGSLAANCSNRAIIDKEIKILRKKF